MAIPPVRPAVKTALILIVWAAFTVAYFERLPIPAFGVHLLGCGIALLSGLSAFGYRDCSFTRVKGESTR